MKHSFFFFLREVMLVMSQGKFAGKPFVVTLLVEKTQSQSLKNDPRYLKRTEQTNSKGIRTRVINTPTQYTVLWQIHTNHQWKSALYTEFSHSYTRSPVF